MSLDFVVGVLIYQAMLIH